MVVARQFASHAEMLTAWDSIKDAANEAIGAHGGTASHHHAVGRDHMPVFVDEVSSTSRAPEHGTKPPPRNPYKGGPRGPMK